MKQTFNNWKSINEGMTIGTQSSEVEALQNDLIRMGYSLPKYGADGKYGQETKMAVMALQNDLIKKGFKLPKWGADGMWGEETKNALAQSRRGRTSSHKAPGTPDHIASKSTTKTQTVTDGEISHTYSGKAADNIELITKSAKDQGITNPNTIIGILSIVGKESAFIPQSERSYENTSPERIRKIGFRAAKSMSDAELNKVKKDPETFWEAMYGYKTKIGKQLGNTEPGDGGKYRGRGFNQLTGRANYKDIGKRIGEDLIGNPDLVNNVDIAAKVLFAFTKRELDRHKIDINGFTTVDDAIRHVARLTAGWGFGFTGKNVKRAIAKADAVKPNFNIA
jgi:predicted chitinase